MSDFDTAVAPVLRRIKAEANVVETHAQRVVTDVADLPSRPEWITKAEDALDLAEQTLSRALKNVRQAREFYRNVKVEQV